MTDVKIFLKSGQVVEFVTCGELNRTKSNITDEITSLTWKNAPNEQTLFTIDLNEISAITYKERN